MRAVQEWTARFRAGQITVDDESKSGRPAHTDFGDAVLAFLERQPQWSAKEIGRALCSRETTVTRVLDELNLRYFAAKWIPHELSDEEKAVRVSISGDSLQMFSEFGPRQWDDLTTGDES
jgi:DNA-binding MarR family transcriptional regulator